MSYRTDIVSTRRELRDFLSLPFEIYRGDRNWVPPVRSEVKRILNPGRNPYFRNASLALFNCYSGLKLKARAAVIINKTFCEKTGKNIAYFGFFEAFNEPDAVRNLFKEVINYCRGRDVEKLEGPFNPSHYSELGIQLNNFGSVPSFFQIYNHAYYNFLITDSGFGVEKILHTRKNENSSDYLREKYGDKIKTDLPGYKVRSFDISNMKNDLESLREIFNDAFSCNWNFIPLSKDEYLFSAKYMKYVTPPDLIQFVEYEGKPVAAVHFVLDINPALKKLGNNSLTGFVRFRRELKKINNAIIFAVGIKKEHRNSKVSTLLFNTTVCTGRRFHCLETTWMYDENTTIISLAERLGLKRDKEFAIYSRYLKSS